MERFRPSPRKPFWRRIGILVLVLIVADLVCTQLYLEQVHQFTEGLERAASDGGIVLFSDFEARGLGPETLRRVEFAASQLKTGAFDKILCAGGARPGRHLYGSELMREWFLASGIPPDRVFLEKTSNDTWSNLKEAFQIVRRMGWQSTTVISSPLHLFRIRNMIPNLEQPPSVSLAAYSYWRCRPAIDRTTLWWQTHYEWTTQFLVKILPARYYQRFLDFLRS